MSPWMIPVGERELDIIQALWECEEGTVAEVHARLVARGHDVAYTTVQTMLNRLEAKGIVARDSSERAHRYRTILDEPDAENAIVDFKYSPSPGVTWWFDHHLSAFLTPEDEAHFHADASGHKF